MNLDPNMLYLMLGDKEVDPLLLAMLSRKKEGSLEEGEAKLVTWVLSGQIERKLKGMSPEKKDRMLSYLLAKEFNESENPEMIIAFLARGETPPNPGYDRAELEIKFGVRPGEKSVEFRPLTIEEPKIEVKKEERKRPKYEPPEIGGVVYG